MSHHYSGPHFGFPHGDARLDITDLFAFPKPDSVGKSILILNVHPSFPLLPPLDQPERTRLDPRLFAVGIPCLYIPTHTGNSW
jgi:hypothetical protein